MISYLPHRRGAFDALVDAANLICHYRGDYGVLTTGDVPATNGQVVETWKNLASDNHHLTASGSGRPVFSASALNGKGGVDFTPTQWMQVAAPLTSHPFSIYVVFESDTTADNQTLISLTDTAVSNSYYTFLLRGVETGDPLTMIVREAGPQTITDTADAYDTSAAIASGVVSSTLQTVLLGGSRASDTRIYDPTSIDLMSIGASRDTSPDNELNARILEARLYETDHDNSTETAVRSQLASFWGL